MTDHPTQEKLRKPFDAFQLAFIFPGLGQVYNGRLKRGIAVAIALWVSMMTLALPWWSHFYGFVISLMLIVGAMLFGILDAILLAVRTRRQTLHSYNRWYVYAIWMVVSYALLFSIWTLIKSSRYQSYQQPTSSMEPSIIPGDVLIADREYYRSQSVHPGDIMVVRFSRDSSHSYIRRCVALPGQVVQFRDRNLIVDGKTWALSGYSLGREIHIQPAEYHDPNIMPPGAGNSDNYGPVTVPPSAVFVVADNVANGLDSRQWGFVDFNNIVGKALYVSFSPQIGRWGTYF